MSPYEERQAELEAVNLPILHGFHQYLIDRRTGKRASCEHVDNIAIFARVFLGDYLDKSLSEGYDAVDDYLGDWFIRRFLSSDIKAMKGNIASFRKFYDFLLLAGHLDQKGHQGLLTFVDNSEAVWLRRLERYNDPNMELEDDWEYGDDDFYWGADPETTPNSLGESPSLTPEEQMPEISAHFVLMLSGSAAKHFGIVTNKLPKTDDFVGEGHWSACWRCELLASNNAGDVSFFLLTNARTLYSLVIPDRSRCLESLMADFARILDLHFYLAGLPTNFQTGGSFRLVRGQPRSLIGSQNELIRCGSYFSECPQTSLEALCKDLNRTPMLKLPETFPEDAFKKHLASDPPAGVLSAGEILVFPKALQN